MARAKNDPPETPTMWVRVKGPVELFERLDRWCERYKAEQGTVMAPNRQAAIRWIVHNFRLKQEAKAKRPRRSKKRTPKRRTG